MSDATGAQFRLPILDSAKEIYKYVFSHFNIILAWSIPILILHALVSTYYNGIAEESGEISGFGALAIVIIILLLAMIPIAIHRNIILKTGYKISSYGMIISKYFWKFVGSEIFYAICIVLPLVIALTIVGILNQSGAKTGTILKYLSTSTGFTISIIALFFATIAVCYVLLRISLVLPMSAAQRKGWVISSWRMTRGNGLRIILIVLLANLFPFFLTYLGVAAEAFYREELIRDRTQFGLEPSALQQFVRSMAPARLTVLAYAVTAIAVVYSILNALLYIMFNAASLSFIYKALEVGRARE